MSALDKKIMQAEAVIFACGEGISRKVLSRAINSGEREMDYILSRLKEKYNGENSGIQLMENGDLISLVTAPQVADMVYKVLDTRKNTPLSNAAMETLAIVAYNQPVSRAFIDQVRGVDSSSSLSTLLNKGLIEEAGRLEIPGRPVAYRTTDVFLRAFSLENIYQLPSVTADEAGQMRLSDG